METNSITIQYKTRRFTLDRVSAEGRYFQIGFESPRWGVRIYRSDNRRVRIIIEKSRPREDGGTSTQFLWDCHCERAFGRMVLCEVGDPATCKRIARGTKWLIVYPMVEDIYSQLRAEIDALHSEGE